MATKALHPTRLTVAPSQQLGKVRNPVAVAAKLRAAGPHKKGATAARQAEKRALAKAKLVVDD
ncbi:hypothetical protein [Massilia sp. DWR3-1-1]|uniref:hypothetical protein n=1 Tax=Massilia sp. DWR3-1-1 TaxID=2804559 RepID=UPI003CF06ABB